jgi:hypothetical protein
MDHLHELALLEYAGHLFANINHSEIIPTVTNMIKFAEKTLK